MGLIGMCKLQKNFSFNSASYVLGQFIDFTNVQNASVFYFDCAQVWTLGIRVYHAMQSKPLTVTVIL
jgi:hypothetical protein